METSSQFLRTEVDTTIVSLHPCAAAKAIIVDLAVPHLKPESLYVAESSPLLRRMPSEPDAEKATPGTPSSIDRLRTRAKKEGPSSFSLGLHHCTLLAASKSFSIKPPVPEAATNLGTACFFTRKVQEKKACASLSGRRKSKMSIRSSGFTCGSFRMSSLRISRGRALIRVHSLDF